MGNVQSGHRARRRARTRCACARSAPTPCACTEPARFVVSWSVPTRRFIVDQIAEQLRDLVVAKVSVVLAGGNVSVLRARGQVRRDRRARAGAGRARSFSSTGSSIAQLVIENVSLPPEVEATLDQKTRMNMLGDLDRYAQLQSADALRDAARNPSGAAAAGVGIGMGAALGQRAMSYSPAASGASAASASEPPPLPGDTWYYAVGDERRGPVDDRRASLRSGDHGRDARLASWNG